MKTIQQKWDMSVRPLRTALLNGDISPEELTDHLYSKIDRSGDHHAWIYLIPKAEFLQQVHALNARPDKNSLPLFGIPYAVKDNIDVGGIPTTAACEKFSYVPEESADVVKKLDAAGALIIGKTNLDQFATGLVGTRSPYGVVRNSVDPEYIAGGSSSGSAVAVALGMVSFALGTDTAGSGRVPAGFNNLFGLKPTRNVISTKGVVPACRSLDCVSIFSLNSEDAALLLEITRNEPARETRRDTLIGSFVYAIPERRFLNFSGNTEYESLYFEALEKFDQAGGIRKEISLAPFLEAADLLYEGPWVAERLAAIKDFFDVNAASMLPETRAIIGGATRFTAVDAFLSLYKLDDLKTQTSQLLQGIDVMVLPTAPTIYTIEDIRQEPYSLNKNLGYYTNFVNLLDLCAFAVPNGFQQNGLPMGITIVARAHEEQFLLQLGKIFKR
ncbi:MAG TPA: allophanate hydrolase [Chryseolinea sp.]|nr:allophanate hydrolase [Chryseolinea sp.]